MNRQRRIFFLSSILAVAALLMTFVIVNKYSDFQSREAPFHDHSLGGFGEEVTLSGTIVNVWVADDPRKFIPSSATYIELIKPGDTEGRDGDERKARLLTLGKFCGDQSARLHSGKTVLRFRYDLGSSIQGGDPSNLLCSELVDVD